ncbi:hypothetical protein O3P69_020827 [Scylla paramamosain]|uniref:CCHC-type domain-containing protein n=1 Tax=Scylla paramamosain TaxID=85552 RepID=A0AAW0TN09_SCYPA
MGHCIIGTERMDLRTKALPVNFFKFTTLWFIHDIEIKASISVSMNTCRGVASHRDFVDMVPAEIVECTTDQDVIEARKIIRMVDGSRSTASVTFTFTVAKLPGGVHVGYESVPVRPYIPNPLRCFKSKIYGHYGNACGSLHSYCSRCTGEGHVVEQCTSLVEKCRNCGSAHFTF